MPPALITIQTLKHRYFFSNRCRIRCIGQHISILQQKLFFRGQTLRKIIWV